MVDTEKLTIDQLTKLAQADKQEADRLEASFAKVGKSAAEFATATKVVADISKKNPEL